MQKKALITGITGQDGSYLAELLKIPVEAVYSITSNNANFLFDFKK